MDFLKLRMLKAKKLVTILLFIIRYLLIFVAISVCFPVIVLAKRQQVM